MLSKTSLDFISDMGLTDQRPYDREKENLRLQEYSLKNRSF